MYIYICILYNSLDVEYYSTPQPTPTHALNPTESTRRQPNPTTIQFWSRRKMAPLQGMMVGPVSVALFPSREYIHRFLSATVDCG
uniref:Uncharacterized protein n=1 Tax=Arundo donax TaxID=35708 RepID=A0A0A9G9K4_ARUDO